ncbi:MAG: Shedu immune nuclease family protein [Methylovirgula sp.]|uniref:Shedu immune nuclease family protein n=1 Tax=Methylovirgula sp. TaxID=1978224 RepID=UPI00307642F5
MKKDHAHALLSGNLDLVIKLAENEVTGRDIVALGYRKKQLGHFERLLADDEYFAAHMAGRNPEAVWQAFFEANPWIFGHGLSYIFMDSLHERKLEQTVRGFSVANNGKRADGLMKTRAAVSSLCFIEIKRHDTELVDEKYRAGVWSPSSELVGGVAQIQETVRGAVKTLAEPFQPKDAFGYPTGEELWGFEPRSYLVIGNLGQFQGDRGTHEDKFRSFELFRRNVRQPEIITFDELLHRARFIVDSNQVSSD